MLAMCWRAVPAAYVLVTPLQRQFIVQRFCGDETLGAHSGAALRRSSERIVPLLTAAYVVRCLVLRFRLRGRVAQAGRLVPKLSAMATRPRFQRALEATS